jgi:hypothetical protein
MAPREPIISVRSYAAGMESIGEYWLYEPRPWEWIQACVLVAGFTFGVRLVLLFRAGALRESAVAAGRVLACGLAGVLLGKADRIELLATPCIVSVADTPVPRAFIHVASAFEGSRGELAGIVAGSVLICGALTAFALLIRSAGLEGASSR